jgi:hypothetical protein
MNNPSEQARERLAKQRQQGDRRQQALHERAEEALHESSDASTEARARAALIDQRHEEEQVEATMLERSEAEINPA